MNTVARPEHPKLREKQIQFPKFRIMSSKANILPETWNVIMTRLQWVM